MIEAALVREAAERPTSDAQAVAPAAPVPAPAGKPRLRGIPDVVATLLAVPAALMLVSHARAGVHSVAATVYGICLVLLFLVSASYHTFMWSLPVRAVWRRVDHSMVYVLIAGSYTPVCLTGMEPGRGHLFLAIIWGVAALGILKSFFWTEAPRLLNTVVYVTMGWLIIPLTPSLYHGVGALAFTLLWVGGVIYTLGAVIYARRSPNPWPQTFGYHEVFHVFVVAAAACHFATMWALVT